MPEEWKPFPLPAGVDPILGEPMRFMVQSESDPRAKYLVDLEEFGFNGWCGCQNFEMRLAPKLKELRASEKPAKVRCKHIMRALIYQAERMNRELAKRTNTK